MELLNPQTLKKRIIFRRLIQVLILLAIFVMAITPIKIENDIYWQLKMGEEIVREHHFPTRDHYSLSAQGEVWTLHEWLPSALFYIINGYFGSAGLVIAKALLTTATFVVLILFLNRLKANLYLSVIVFALAAIINTRGAWMVFPSIFEYFFLAITLYLLEIYRERQGRLLIPAGLAILSLVWANSHGSFFLLPVVLGAYVIGDWVALRLRTRWPGYDPLGQPLGKGGRLNLIGAAGIALITPFLTPNSWETYLYPFRVSLGKFTPYVNEYQHFWDVWQGDWSDFVHGFAFILMWVLLLVVLLSYRRLHPTDFFLGLGFWLLAMVAVRHVAIFALAAFFLIGRYLKTWFGEYRGWFKRSLIGDMVLIFIIVLATYYYKNRIAPLGWGWSEEIFPKAAAELILNHKVPGNMFNHYNYGGYLIWKMPDYKVFMDGRLEMYQGKAGEDYLTIIEGKPGYKELLAEYRINFFILYLTDGIVQYLAVDPHWKYVYHDKQYVVFIQDAPQNAEILAKTWSPEKQADFQKGYQAALDQLWTDRFNQQGIQAAQKADLTVALSAFEKAVKLDPSSLQIRLNLAQVLGTMGRYEEAKKEYEFILSHLDTENQVAKSGLSAIKKLLDAKAK